MMSILNKKILIVDGGLSNVLQPKLSFDFKKDPLWTGAALIQDPKAIQDVHLAYLEAGADIITTATYQTTYRGFCNHKSLSNSESDELIKKSVSLAQDAIDQYMTSEFCRGIERPIVAGSVGPYGAFLCDGSEYNGNYIDKVSEEEIIDIHLGRIKSLIDGKTDILAIETIPSVKEAEIILKLVQDLNPTIKVWITFSVKESHDGKCTEPVLTAHGDSFILALETVVKFPQVFAFGINCCSPFSVEPFLKQVSEHLSQIKIISPTDSNISNLKLIVYPNSGDEWIPGVGWAHNKVTSLTDFTLKWISLGASIIGGCCEIGVEEIKSLRSFVDTKITN